MPAAIAAEQRRERKGVQFALDFSEETARSTMSASVAKSTRDDRIYGTKAVKELVRIMCKVVGGIAALVFLLAPLTDSGLAFMAGSVIVALICMAGRMWSEPDEDPPSPE